MRQECVHVIAGGQQGRHEFASATQLDQIDTSLASSTTPTRVRTSHERRIRALWPTLPPPHVRIADVMPDARGRPDTCVPCRRVPSFWGAKARHYGGPTSSRSVLMVVCRCEGKARAYVEDLRKR